MEINDLLCYVTTALDVVNNDTIIMTCVAFYGAARIKKAKQRIFNILEEEIKWRRGDDRIKGDMQDILDLISSSKDQGKVLPKFVAETYNSLPPASGFEVIGGELINLIDEVSKLREEINYLKTQRVTEKNIESDMVSIKENIFEIKNEIRKLSKVRFNNTINSESTLTDEILDLNVIPSAPPASQLDTICTEEYVFGTKSKRRKRSKETSSPSANLKFCNNNYEVLNNDLILPTNDDLSNQNIIIPSAPPASQMDLSFDSGRYVNKKLEITENAPKKSWAEVASNIPNINKKSIISKKSNRSSINVLDDMNINKSLSLEEIHEKTNDEMFTLVKSRKKSKQTIYGTKSSKPNDKLKSAKTLREFYVGRCDLNVESNHIEEFVKENLNLNWLKVEELNCRNPYSKSFKIVIEAEFRENLLKEDFWPKGIICRKFFNNINNGRFK